MWLEHFPKLFNNTHCFFLKHQKYILWSQQIPAGQSWILLGSLKQLCCKMKWEKQQE